jgi:hypothetical protein
MRSSNFITILITIFIILFIVFVIANIYRNNNMNDILVNKKPYSSIDQPVPYERLPYIVTSCISENNCNGLEQFNSLLL